MEESGCWLPLRLVLAVAWVGAWGWGLSLKPSESSGRLKLASPTSSAAGPKWSLYLLPQVPGTPLVVPQQRGRGGGCCRFKVLQVAEFRRMSSSYPFWATM